jgi:hypothetical protein
MFPVKDSYKTYSSNNKKSVQVKQSRVSSSVSKQSASQSSPFGQGKNFNRTPKKSIKSKSRKSVGKVKSKPRLVSSQKSNQGVLRKQSGKMSIKKDNETRVKNFTGCLANSSSKMIQRKKKSFKAQDYTLTNSQYNKALIKNSCVKSPEQEPSPLNVQKKYSFSNL